MRKIICNFRLMIFGVLPAFLHCQPALSASRIITNDGSAIVGEVERLQGDIYFVRTPYGVVQVPRQQVKQIQSLGGEPTPCPTGTSCDPPKLEPQRQPLRLNGSNTVGAELVPNLLQAFAESFGALDQQWLTGASPEERSLSAKGKPDTAFAANVSAHGSGKAIPALVKKEADIGMMSREITKEEIAAFTEAGLGDATAATQQHVLALDGVLVLVHRDNAVKRLTLSDIAAIFAGEKTDWSQVGGKPGSINIYRRADKSGTLDTFQSLVMKTKKIVASAQPFESSSDLSDAVASDPGGIGFAGLAYARNAKPLEIGLECGLGSAPGEFLIKSEEYPLSRRLFLYNAAEPGVPEVRRFVDYALSADAQPIIARSQFINLSIDRSDQAYTAQRIAEAAYDKASDPRQVVGFAQKMWSAQRLSVTFRFTFGGSDLDTRAVRDIDRLVTYLGQPENKDRRVMILGYADSRGTLFNRNGISLARARTIERSLVDRGVAKERLTVQGLGSFAPVACDGPLASPDEAGMRRNRRVEIWLQ